VRLDILAIDRSYPRVEALFELVRDVYSTSNHMSESFDEKYPAPSVLATEIAGLAERSGGLVLVAERERRPQGYLTIEPRIQARLRHTADLHMGVHAAARGQGIGKRLLEDAIARVAEAQIVEIVYLMVRADNLPALGLYERSGFDRVATLPRDTKADGRYYDGVLMRRTVAPLAIPAER
jgi:putative acetyltransferase